MALELKGPDDRTVKHTQLDLYRCETDSVLQLTSFIACSCALRRVRQKVSLLFRTPEVIRNCHDSCLGREGTERAMTLQQLLDNLLCSHVLPGLMSALITAQLEGLCGDLKHQWGGTAKLVPYKNCTQYQMK